MHMWAGQLADAIKEGASPSDLDELVSEFRGFFTDRTYRPHTFWFRNDTREKLLWRSRTSLHPADAMEISAGDVVVTFDFGAAHRREAAIDLSVIAMTMLLMMGFSLLISSAVSKVALTPLESLLANICALGSTMKHDVESIQKQLFRTSHTENSGWPDSQEGEVLCTETALLAYVVKRLATLSELAVWKAKPRDSQTLQYLGEILEAECPSMDDAREQPRHSSQGDVRDECIEALGESCASAVHSWDFNPRAFGMAEGCAICAVILGYTQGKLQGADVEKLNAFVRQVAPGYSKGPQYHTWSHAVDVTHVLFMLLHQCSQNCQLMSGLEEFALVVSAVCHDLGHPGVTNDFLVQTASDLAIRYNDTSPLENMHCARLFEIMTKPEAAIFSSLSRGQYKEVRTVCIEAILHTDAKHHVGLVKGLQMFCEMKSGLLTRARDFRTRSVVQHDKEQPEEEPHAVVPSASLSSASEMLWPPRELLDAMWEPEGRTLIRNSLLHFADISNPVRPFWLCKEWAVSILDEFFAQGDLERRWGLPVFPLHDRERTNLAFSQIGFIDFFVGPLVFVMVRVLTPLEVLADVLVHNAQMWADEWEQETMPSEEETANLASRLRRLEDRALLSRSGYRVSPLTSPRRLSRQSHLS